MHNEQLPSATPQFWERIAVAMAIGQYNVRLWSIDCGRNPDYFRQLRNRLRRPTEVELDLLCRETGCTIAFLDNPEPFDISA